MPSSGDKVAAAAGACKAALLASLYSDTASTKLKPINGQTSSNMVHSARPLTISANSLARSGGNGAPCERSVLGERKEELLQRRLGDARLRAQLAQRADSANPSAGQKNEAIAPPLGVRELVNRKNEGAPRAGRLAQDFDDVAGLAKIKAVERLVHQQHTVRCQQADRQQQPA